MRKKILIALVIIFTLIFSQVAGAYAVVRPTISFNQRGLEYVFEQWAEPEYSSLFQDNGDFVRIERIYDNKYKILVETFDKALKIKSKKFIPLVQPIYAGAYKWKDNYYLVFGKNNKNQKDDAVVITVVKYDLEFSEEGRTEINNINTTVPFDAGSLRMAAKNDQLYIRTCHEMYESSDGKRHQANLMIQISTKDMKMVDTFHEIGNTSMGYVSHSFNQFILIDEENNIVALDHGDAYPRAHILFKYDKKASEESFKGEAKSLELVKFKGKKGDNRTHATLGGLEEGKNNYLAVGTMNSKEVILYTASKDLKDSKEKVLAKLSKSNSKFLSVPKISKLSDNKFLVMWEDIIGNMGTSGSINYTLVNEDGKTLFKTKKVKGDLSECKPTIIKSKEGNKALWYVSDLDGLMFYSIDEKGNFNLEKIYVDKPIYFQVKKLKDKAVVKWGKNPRSTGYEIYKKVGKGKWTKIASVDKKASRWIDEKPVRGEKNMYKMRSLSSTEKSGFTEVSILKF